MSGAVSGAGWKPPSAEAQAIEQDARAIALTLTDEVGQAYFRVRALNEQVEIALSVLTLRRDSSEIIAKRASVGLASDLNVKRTEVLVAESAGQIPDLNRLCAMAMHRLEVLTGSPPRGGCLAAEVVADHDRATRDSCRPPLATVGTAA